MKKSERLNQELFFLRTHPQFNLNQLMKTFGISKSTALRDIEALENLGVPLYVESHRLVIPISKFSKNYCIL